MQLPRDYIFDSGVVATGGKVKRELVVDNEGDFIMLQLNHSTEVVAVGAADYVGRPADRFSAIQTHNVEGSFNVPTSHQIRVKFSLDNRDWQNDFVPIDSIAGDGSEPGSQPVAVRVPAGKKIFCEFFNTCGNNMRSVLTLRGYTEVR